MHLWLESNYLQPELPICGMVSNLHSCVPLCSVTHCVTQSLVIKLVLLHVHVLLSHTVMVRLQLRWVLFTVTSACPVMHKHLFVVPAVTDIVENIV